MPVVSLSLEQRNSFLDADWQPADWAFHSLQLESLQHWSEFLSDFLIRATKNFYLYAVESRLELFYILGLVLFGPN